MDPITSIVVAGGAGAWIGNKLLGPTAEVIGKDLKELYENGKDRIVNKAIKKTRNIDEAEQTNLRVTRDVFWNGSFTDEEICAEYFGGILASSRSKDGKDDSGVFYADIVKSLSSGQLKMHYLIYRLLNKALISNPGKQKLNTGKDTELGNEKLFIPMSEVEDPLKQEELGAILHGLHAKNLIGEFKTDNYKLKNGKILPYLEVEPISLGVQLFAIANNRFKEFLQFSTIDFGDFDSVPLPKYFAQSIDELLEKMGLE